MKNSGECIVDRVWKIRCIVFESGTMPEDVKDAVIVLLHKDECKNYKWIRFLSVVGIAHDGILIDRVKTTDGVIGDKQGGSRPGRGCVDKVFPLKQLVKKACERDWKIYVAFMDFEQVYNRVVRTDYIL